MTAKPVILFAQAKRDIREAVIHYAREAGETLSVEFAAALEARLTSISDHPGLGSLRYAHELKLPGLRSLSLKRFPYLVFYVEAEDHIDLWRVVHAARDIPAWLSDGTPEH